MNLEQRTREIFAEEAKNEPAWWWLSFCHADKPKGEQFVGACLVNARGFAHAVRRTRDLGINPGGEVAGWGPLEPPDEVLALADRLLTKAECDAIDTETVDLTDEESS